MSYISDFFIHYHFSTIESLKSGSVISVLGIIMQLRKCCNHPNLFEPRPVTSPFIAEPIQLRIASSLFSLCERLSDKRVDDPLYTLHQHAFASFSVWRLLNEISDEKNLNNSAGTSSPTSRLPKKICGGLRLAIDQNFKCANLYVNQKEEQINTKEEVSIEKLDSHMDDQLVNGLKRTAPASSFIMEFNNNGDANDEDAPSPSKQKCLITNALEEIRRRRMAESEENRRLGIWLTSLHRPPTPPILPLEIIGLLKKAELWPQKTLWSRTTIMTKQKDEKVQPTEEGLFKHACDTISENLLCWAEDVVHR